MSETRNSSLLRKITVVVVICFFGLPTQAKYGGGTGEPNDPYLIYTAEQMNEIGLSVNWDDLYKCFKLMADIDLGGYTGEEFNIIGSYPWPPFSGVFDGNGHTISNFIYTSTDSDNIGLFGYVDEWGENAEIKNLGLIDPNVDSGLCGENIGALVGFMRNGIITNCYIKGGSVYSGDNIGPLQGSNVGFLVGKNDSGNITNCYAEGGSVSGYRGVGGLVGGNNLGTITNCCSTAGVSGDFDGGGLVGWDSEGTITNCCSTGSVLGDSSVGGLVGGNDFLSTITNCCATGSVSGYYGVGGLVGYNHMSTITNSYSIGNVSGDNTVGGLVGGNFGYYFLGWMQVSKIINCYSTGSVEGVENIGGLVGDRNSLGGVNYSFWDIETSGQTTSDGGAGKTTDEMQTASTFYAWACGDDFAWTIDEGVDYPRLVWENKPGELLTIPSGLYGGGTGEPNDPHLIYTTEQFNLIGLVPCDFDKHFLLCADIDLSGFAGNNFNIIGNYVNPFSGVFDGSGYTISNFTYTPTDKYDIGLFGSVRGPNAEIKNLGLINPYVDAGTAEEVGLLVGYLNRGTITNCYVETGSVSGDAYVGGLVGGQNKGTITNCYVKGSSVSGNYRVGGLVGRDSRGTITNCYAKGSSVSGNYRVGGLVGTSNGTITNCYSTNSVSGNDNVGGLVGVQYNGTITNSYSTGNASGTENVGGLVGRNEKGTITDCYSTGSASGTENIGGLIGYNDIGDVTASFWDIETSGQSTSAGGTGLSTNEMQMQVTFTDAGWDFVGETVNGIEDIWFIPQGDYPHLWWEGMQVPMKLTPRTLNCRSEGNWVKAHITLPEGFTVEDVDSNRPAVLHSFGFQSLPPYVFFNKDKLVEIEAAFERQAVCSLVGNWPQELTVAGFFSDGNIFLGTSTVRIIHPGMKVIENLAWYWLNADCVHPEFCNGIDTNRDSIVNLMDYALLLNSQVEFTRE